MKPINILFFFLSFSFFSQSSTSEMIQFKIEYTKIEFEMNNKIETQNFKTTLALNAYNYGLKQALNDLELQYATNNIKLAVYKNRYEKEVLNTQYKYQVLIQEAQSKHLKEIGKIQLDFELQKRILQEKYQMAKN